MPLFRSFRPILSGLPIACLLGSALLASAAAAESAGYDPDRPLAWNNHPHLIAADDPDPKVASVREAHATGAFPERLSATAPPACFDLECYLADPAAFCQVIEPSRVHQTATPGPDVKAIAYAGASDARLAVGETVTLQAQAEPGMPVSWLSVDGGLFVESRLNAVTVIADEQGIASVDWHANPGTINGGMVLASCPTMAGTLEFTVFVTAAPVAAVDDQ